MNVVFFMRMGFGFAAKVMERIPSKEVFSEV
jgi:hypothetical protein